MFLSTPFPMKGSSYCVLEFGFLVVAITEAKVRALGLDKSGIFVRDLDPHRKYEAQAYVDISNNTKFLNLLKGNTNYGNMEDVLLASTVLGLMLQSVYPAPIPQVMLSFDDSVDYVIRFCHDFYETTGKTPATAQAYLPTMVANKDMVFLKKLVRDTVFENNPLSAIDHLRAGGITALWSAHYDTIAKASRGNDRSSEASKFTSFAKHFLTNVQSRRGEIQKLKRENVAAFR